MRAVIYTDGRNFYALRRAGGRLLLLEPRVESLWDVTPGERRDGDSGARACRAARGGEGKRIGKEAAAVAEAKDMRTGAAKAGAEECAQGAAVFKSPYEEELAKSLAQIAEAGRLLAAAGRTLLNLAQM